MLLQLNCGSIAPLFAASSPQVGSNFTQLTCASALWTDPPHHAEQVFIVVMAGPLRAVLYLDHSGQNRGRLVSLRGGGGYCCFGFRPV